MGIGLKISRNKNETRRRIWEDEVRRRHSTDDNRTEKEKVGTRKRNKNEINKDQ